MASKINFTHPKNEASIELKRKELLALVNNPEATDIPAEVLGDYKTLYWKFNDEGVLETFWVRRHAPVSEVTENWWRQAFGTVAGFNDVFDIRQARTYKKRNASLESLASDLQEVENLKNKCDRVVVVERIKATLADLGFGQLNPTAEQEEVQEEEVQEEVEA